MKYLSFVFSFCLIFATSTFSQRVDSLDVHHYDLSVRLRNISQKNLQGNALITATAVFNQTKSLVLDLQKLPVSAANCNGQALVFSQSDSTLRLILDKTYQAGDTLKISIEYAGQPVTDPKWGGFYFSGNYAYNMGVGMGSNPVNYGRCWFPCIDNFTDRATYSFHITTDTGFMAVCSGLQSPATPNQDGSITWHWQLGQTIPSYLANVAVSKYVLVQSSYAGINKNIPIVLAVAAADTQKVKNSFVRLSNAMTCFESKFGPYLFDRIGYVGVPFNAGAMEHACNISYPLYAVDGTANYETLMAHELSHHWWGNLVTTRTASDMWLNEGWASYCEALFLECAYGKQAYNDKIEEELFDALRNASVRDQGYWPVSGVPLAQTYGTHVYTKGGLMVHNLRLLMNDDKFFEACKSYLNKYAFKDANSDDLKNEFQKFSTYSLTNFFNSFIYDKGHLDVQFQQVNTNPETRVVQCNVMSRYKTQFEASLIIHPTIYYKDGSKKTIPYAISANVYQPRITLPIKDYENAAFVVVNENSGMALGSISEAKWIKANGVNNFSKALFSANVQSNGDSSFLHVQHHFARPWIDPSQLPRNVFVSSERFWEVNGLLHNNFKAIAFLNYDGSNGGRLDNELITQTEDSLVVLYRANANQPFEIVSDLTYQPGGSKTDKVGRFLVNNLKPGHYTFGYRSVLAGLNQTLMEAESLKAYPNPSADGRFTIEIPKLNDSASLAVYTLNGVLVQTRTLEKGTQNLEVSVGPSESGQTYLAIIYSGNKKYVAKLIHQ